jgi:transposase InsO family protein
MSPWDSFSIDFVVGLEPSVGPDGRVYDSIITFVDRCTKFVVLVPTFGSVTARDVAQICYERIFTKYGLPLEIVSDRDPKFTSVFWKETFSLIGVKLAMSTAHHPQTDSQTEVYNQTVEIALRAYCSSQETYGC